MLTFTYDLFLIMCRMSVSQCGYGHKCRCPKLEGSESPGADVIGGYDPPSKGAGN